MEWKQFNSFHLSCNIYCKKWQKDFCASQGKQRHAFKNKIMKSQMQTCKWSSIMRHAAFAIMLVIGTILHTHDRFAIVKWGHAWKSDYYEIRFCEVQQGLCLQGRCILESLFELCFFFLFLFLSVLHARCLLLRSTHGLEVEMHITSHFITHSHTYTRTSALFIPPLVFFHLIT